MSNPTQYPPVTRQVPKFQSDPMNSTYRWVIQLTQGQQGNRVNELVGYSKGHGYENPNKAELLIKKLVNPVLPYVYKADSIVIYEQVPGLPGHLHPVIAELWGHAFVLHHWAKEDFVLTSFLQRYYADYLTTGTLPPDEDRRKNVRTAFYTGDLDHAKHTFKTLTELQDFCRVRVPKYSRTCMVGWYHKHSLFQPELFETNITQAVQHAVDTAPSMEAAQAAMGALQARHASNR